MSETVTFRQPALPGAANRAVPGARPIGGKDSTMNSDRVLQNPAAAFAPTLLLMTSLLIASGLPARAQGAEELDLTVGMSIVIDYPEDIRQISTSDPDIIDVSAVTTRQILVHGRGLGSATMVIWTVNDQRMFYNASVSLNVDPLRRILRETFPEDAIEVSTSGETISLTGMAESQEIADRAATLAAAFAPTVVNNLLLPPPPIEQQVLLRVKFATLDRQKAQQLGIDFFTNGAFNVNGGFVSSGSSDPNIGGILSTLDNFQVAIEALQRDNVLQILAEPNLVTSNGQEANFLVGGEFPIPVLQGAGNTGAVTIQYKEFGIRLRFTPQITGNETIKLTLNQEVSSLDLANGVNLSGFFIPALSTRRAETLVELADGQSFVVAGLLSNEERDQFSQIPVISQIPILGNLFKSRQERKQRTELVMLVTPEITMPLGPNDPRPEIGFPNEFLPRLTPEELQGMDPGNVRDIVTAGN